MGTFISNKLLIDFLLKQKTPLDSSTSWNLFCSLRKHFAAECFLNQYSTTEILLQIISKSLIIKTSNWLKLLIWSADVIKWQWRDCQLNESCEANLICSGVPPDVALVMAQAASFLVLNSAFCRMSISTGKMFASITVCGGGWEISTGEMQKTFKTDLQSSTWYTR